MLLRSQFDPEDTLIVVPTHVFGKYGRSVELRFALDTGATYTTLRPHVSEGIGYSEADALGRTVIRSAIGSEAGFRLKVPAITALAITLADIYVQVAELADDSLDGLLGLSFLAKLNYEIRSTEGVILVQRAE